MTPPRVWISAEPALCPESPLHSDGGKPYREEGGLYLQCTECRLWGGSLMETQGLFLLRPAVTGNDPAQLTLATSDCS
ncbi:hypothetical protein JZ751_007930 [Albula glossodonta]|uniref:Uncharacterized protein n=1 Tax=Albula glossodonta TaxID=121402 RepID=A0A8T2P930_9TELE|nr:hypothetical protein JZ751_007930 [Albula glossodonta]